MALLSHEDSKPKSYDLFEGSMEETAGKVVRLVKSKKSPDWVSEKTDKLRDEKNKEKWGYKNKHACCIRPNSLIPDKLEDYMITFLEKEFPYFRRTR